MNTGIVGHEKLKFTPKGEAAARAVIRHILSPEYASDRTPVLVSGHSPLGGIDIWAEEEAEALGLKKLIYAPANFSWDGGYKARNIKIATHSDIVHVIVVTSYPATYTGMRFDICYHCAKAALHQEIQSNTPALFDFLPPMGRNTVTPNATNHIKSGGCWTAWHGYKLGKQARWHLIEN